jgi:uncharacterized protein involved in response to NO
MAAGLWSVVAILAWMLMVTQGSALPTRLDPLSWHIHEMLFGVVMAGVGGFLLTAIPNWTGRPAVTGSILLLLVTLWAAGRIACIISAWLPGWIAPAVDLSFPCALESVAARELVAAGNRRNYPLLLPLLVLGLANLLMHLESLNFFVPPGLGWRLGIAVVLVLISVIGGRIIPAFTRNWLSARGATRLPAPSGLVDRVALATLHAGLLLWCVLPTTAWVGGVLLLGSVANLVRLARWCGIATLAEPLLTILHIGYLWLVVGAGLLGWSLLSPSVPIAAPLHVLTIGAFGTMLLAVMTRATLGHMGRHLHADGVTVAIYLSVSSAMVLRVAAVWPTAWGQMTLSLASWCWVAAFLLFLVRYGPMLFYPRVAK